MAAKSWDQDFRYAAIQASIRQIGDQPFQDLSQLSCSCCLPVAKKPIVGWSPGWFMLFALILGFVGLFGGMVLGGMAEKQQGNAFAVLLTAAVCSSMGGLSLFFMPLVFDRQLVRWLIGERARWMMNRARTNRVMAAEVTHADLSAMKISITGDDFALILFDDVNRRVLMEGIGARYIIQAVDVESIAPFLYKNYLGAEIVYRIGETELKLAIARTSLLSETIRQVPILFFLKRFVSNKILNRFRETLNVD